jgi:hypothetical protein
MSQTHDTPIAKRSTRMERFLWWCAGADAELLESECPPTDRAKYFGMGGVVLATGILAGLSSGFAFYTIFSPKGDAMEQDVLTWGITLASAVFGILWGLMIFNLDRFIVSAGGKGDMKEGLSWTDLGQAWPRFLMAIILGLVISKPLEIRIMKSEIDAELSLRQEERLFQLNQESDSTLNTQKAIWQAKIDPLKASIAEKQEYLEKRRIEIKDQMRNLELEAEGKTGSGTPGRGPAYRDKKENLERMDAELAQLRTKYAEEEKTTLAQIDGYQAEIAALDGQIKQRREENKQRAKNLDGLLERIHIAHDIGFTISIFLSLMFIIIEITPLLFKMMMTKTPYDYLMEHKGKEILAGKGIAIEHHVHRDSAGREVETVRYLEVERRVQEKRAANQANEAALDAWLDKRKKDIAANPDDFIKEA